MVSKDECTFDNEVMKWFIGVMVVLCGASLAYFMSDAGFSGMFAKQPSEGAKATVRLADGCSREVTHVIDTFGREGRCLAVLDAKCVRGDEGGSGYRILFSSDISPEEADRFIARAYGLCLRREASPFSLSFDMLDCPRWADACKAYIERSLAEQGLAVAYDSGVYERERPLVTRYLRDVLDSQQQPSAALTSVKLWDFYLDERPSGERGRNILGEVSMSVSPGKLPQPLLAEKPALPPGDHWTPLHLAAECGDEAELAALLSAGADPNARDARGDTPLHLAARCGDRDLMRLLTTGGADGLLKNKDGQSAEELLQELLKLRQARRGWLEVKGMVTIPDACSLSSVTVYREAGQLQVKEFSDGQALTPEQFRARLTRMQSHGGEWVILFRLQDASLMAELEPWLSVCDALGVRSRCTEE